MSTKRIALKADKYVTINRLSDDHVEVAVVGVDDREIASSSRFLQEYVVKWMDVVNKNPSRVPVPEHDPDTQYDPQWAWTGFTMYGEWDKMKEAISTLRQISRNLGMKVYIGKKGVRGWPKPPRMASDKTAKALTASDRSRLIRLASTMEKGSPERKAILAGLKGASTKTAGMYGKPQDWEIVAGRRAMQELGISAAQMRSLLDSMVVMREENRNLPEGDEPLKGKRDWITVSMTDGLVRPLGRKVVGQFYDLVYGSKSPRGLMWI